jgi:hypothetical protein
METIAVSKLLTVTTHYKYLTISQSISQLKKPDLQELQFLCSRSEAKPVLGVVILVTS